MEQITHDGGAQAHERMVPLGELPSQCCKKHAR